MLSKYTAVYSQEHVKLFYLTQASDVVTSLDPLATPGTFVANTEELEIYPITMSPNANNIYTIGAE